jgi:penicillin-binding protein 1A
MMTTLHAGLLALDPQTGAVRAWAGGIDFRLQPYDQILARRQLASVFKPFIFAAALEDGMDPCRYLGNDSVTLSGFNDWSPENYNHSYGGKYSLAGALAQSMNIPTFSLFMLIGFNQVDRLWKKMGFSFPLVDTPSLAMGTAEASIFEVARAYASFANGGLLVTPRYIESIMAPDGRLLWQSPPAADGERVLSERSALLMGAMLQKAIREGTGASVYSVYGVKIPLAGKTGTSQNYADAWFAAFNPGLVIVSRVGASSPAIHFNSGSNGSGSALALPLVALTLKKAETDPELMQMINRPFPVLPPELAGALDCPDFRDKTFFDRLIDIFREDEIDYEKARKRRRPFRIRIIRR